MKQHHAHHPGDHSLGNLLHQCGHYYAHRIDCKKGGQEGLLSIIAQHTGITQRELAEQLGIQPASVSELLMKLERKGLVLRQKDEQDRRAIKVQLTEEGRKVLTAPAEEVSDPFQALSAEEQEQLRSLLEKLLTDWSQRYPHEHRHHKHDHKENHHGKHK